MCKGDSLNHNHHSNVADSTTQCLHRLEVQMQDSRDDTLFDILQKQSFFCHFSMIVE